MRFTVPTAFCSAMTLAGMFCFAFVLFAELPEEKKSSVSVKPKSLDSSRKMETQKASKKRLVSVEVAREHAKLTRLSLGTFLFELPAISL